MQFLLIKFVLPLACEYLLPKVFYYGCRIIHGRASPRDVLGNVTMGITFHEFSMIAAPIHNIYALLQCQVFGRYSYPESCIIYNTGLHEKQVLVGYVRSTRKCP